MEKIPKAGETKPIETTPVTTKTLASDGGLEELLKKDRGVSLNDPLVTLGATEQTLSVPLERLDNNPRVFLVVQDKKGGETKPFLFPTLLALKTTMYPLVEDEQEIVGSKHACIILRGPRSKPKLENIFVTYVGCRKRANNAQVDEYRNITKHNIIIEFLSSLRG